MFFNQGFNKMPPRMNNPFYGSMNNMPYNGYIANNLLNPERPFANEFKEENSNRNIVTNPELEESIKQFMQNEKNASVYYEKLAEKTRVEKNKKILYSISKNANEEVNYAKKFCKYLYV